jgi:hypothetical protein
LENKTQASGKTQRGDAMKAAMLSALVIPGAGQLLNRQWGKGFGIMLLFLVTSLAVLGPITLAFLGYYLNIASGNLDNAAQSLQEISDQWIHLVVLLIVSIAVYVYSIVDAYRYKVRNTINLEKCDE